jgi:hypothetical protein
MPFVSFILSKTDGSKIELKYQSFENDHSKLWIDSIQHFIESEQTLSDCNRVYNFNDYLTELGQNIKKCNLVIDDLNSRYNLKIPYITIKNLQNDINYVHTFFVDNENQTDKGWIDLNYYLHGIEIIERAKSKKIQGQIFYNLPNTLLYDIPIESYKSFTIKKQYGYCYANYPHIGRHILEMFNAKDDEAEDEHVIPMSKIGGGSYLWLGDSTSFLSDMKKKIAIRDWFKKNKINEIVKMEWGDPKLAIGWLPVAKLDTNISKKDLIGLNRLEEIKILI